MPTGGWSSLLWTPSTICLVEQARKMDASDEQFCRRLHGAVLDLTGTARFGVGSCVPRVSVCLSRSHEDAQVAALHWHCIAFTRLFQCLPMYCVKCTAYGAKIERPLRSCTQQSVHNGPEFEKGGTRVTRRMQAARAREPSPTARLQWYRHDGALAQPHAQRLRDSMPAASRCAVCAGARWGVTTPSPAHPSAPAAPPRSPRFAVPWAAKRGPQRTCQHARNQSVQRRGHSSRGRRDSAHSSEESSSPMRTMTQ